LFAHLGSPQKNNDRKANDRKAGGRVRSSQYLRAQAQLYFDIARLLSEPKAIEEASATATQYLAQADEICLAQADEMNAQNAFRPNGRWPDDGGGQMPRPLRRLSQSGRATPKPGGETGVRRDRYEPICRSCVQQGSLCSLKAAQSCTNPARSIASAESP
jgi:hypothetical protein